MTKDDFTDYRSETQKIRECLAQRCFYQGCTTIMNDISKHHVFDGIPLLVYYSDYIKDKDLNIYQKPLKKRQE